MKPRRFLTKSEFGLLVLTAIFMCLLLFAAGRGANRGGSWDYRITARASQEDVTPDKAPPVDINTADAEELDTLPGIGPVLAERIIAWRQANGPFMEIEQLLEVSGIGEATLAELREFVTVGEQEQTHRQEEPE